MVSKGQKFSKYSDNLKQEIMDKINQGISMRYLAKQYNIPPGTVFTWADKKKHPEKVSGFKRGRKKDRNLTKEDWQERYEILKKYQAFLKVQRERK